MMFFVISPSALGSAASANAWAHYMEESPMEVNRLDLKKRNVVPLEITIKQKFSSGTT